MKTLYTIDFKTWGIEFEFKLQYLWLGVYWENDKYGTGAIDVWLCLFPCFPIHFIIVRSRTELPRT